MRTKADGKTDGQEAAGNIDTLPQKLSVACLKVLEVRQECHAACAGDDGCDFGVSGHHLVQPVGV